jgi:hypothetical protein
MLSINYQRLSESKGINSIILHTTELPFTVGIIYWIATISESGSSAHRELMWLILGA